MSFRAFLSWVAIMCLPPISLYLRLMRFDAPTGIWLLMWPCWWSVTLAGGGEPRLLLVFLLGAAVMRAAGCIINDLFDRVIDGQVERTRDRPLASGAISPQEALTLLFLLLVLALVLAGLLGTTVLWLSAAWLPPVVLYPLMKRITWWPQLFLGLTFNAGAIIGWAAVRGEVEWPALLLYAGAAAWTLGYDTLYAHQDVRDDARIGVKSTARRLGRNTKLWVAVFYGLFGASLFSLGILLGMRPVFLFFLLIILVQLAAQVRQVRLEDAASCRDAFRSNAWTGFLVFLLFFCSSPPDFR